MADLVVEEDIEFATANYLAVPTIVFTPKTVEVSEDISFASANYLAAPLLVFTSKSVEVGEDLSFASGLYLSTIGGGAQRVYTKSVVIEELPLPFIAGDNSKQIVYNIADTVTPTVPTPSAGGYELLYPILPKYDQDVVLSQSDSVAWKRLQLTAPKGFNLLGYRIRRVTLDAMVAFFEDNRNKVVELYTPNLYPFGNQYSRSNVRVVSYNAYTLEQENNFRIDVLYQFVSGIA